MSKNEEKNMFMTDQAVGAVMMALQKKQKVGSLVKDFIEETREELKSEKETLREQEYEE